MREKMLQLFRTCGGVLIGTVCGETFRFTPAIDGRGELHVSIFRGNSKRRYLALPLDQWSQWAEANVTLQ